MFNVITPDSIDEPVKWFLHGLDISSEPSLIEIGGRRVFLLVRPAHDTTQPVEAWNESKSKRRHQLIDRKLDSVLAPLEAVELAELNEAFDQYLAHMAPCPSSTLAKF